MNISLKQKINIMIVGGVSTLLILLMVETAFAQIISDFLIGHISDNLILFIIILGLFVFTIIISIVVGIFITKDIRRLSVLKASIMSLSCLLLFLFIISNATLFIRYKEIYSEIHGLQIVLIFPQVLIYFSIYILGDVFLLFILEIVVYYIFFVFFLENFYEGKYRE